jgi:hypothetical protein
MQSYTNTFYNDWFHYQNFIPSSDVFDLYSLDSDLKNDLLEQVHSACKLIARRSQSIYLLLSGGTDSEVIATSFASLDIPVTAVIMQYPSGVNQADVDNAVEICNRLGLNYTVDEFDPRTIINNIADYKHTYPCVMTIAELVYLEFRKRYPQEATFVRGEGEPRLTKIEGKWCVCFSKNTFYYFVESAKKLYPNDVPFFYMYTKELYQSYLCDARLNNILEVADISNIANKKHIVFNNYGMTLTQKKKLTGFESYKFSQIPMNNFEVSTYFVQLRKEQ